MKINKEGLKIIATSGLIVAIVLAANCLMSIYGWLPMWATITILVVALGLWGFIIRFFREPARPLLKDDQIVFSPCDGEVVVVEPTEENEYMGCKCLQISVFMSVHNVHVNWFPVSGEVEYFKYHPGKFLVAWHPKSSEDNERTTTVVNTGKHKVLFRQIAGFVARRIVSYAEVGKRVEQNTKCGFIKFGSRVDLLLPLDCEPLVKIGDKVVGSQTPLVRLK
ncbi:MAG: phosphatidylserine decarboxylase family protein [Rikenellaceae bacterium]|jgi:phosphatidylserine decarboxylase|nr:phosphatidylserine decarboxylase family protein [Rikenellaceae bacterium]MBQ5894245.1 phosphatidylserine decarboxylase family protein [Rikenellaceae bacterium]